MRSVEPFYHCKSSSLIEYVNYIIMYKKEKILIQKE
jgi:hypothetical protein